MDYEYSVPVSVSPSGCTGQMSRKWTTGPFGIRMQISSFSSHTQLTPHSSSGNGPRLSDQLVHNFVGTNKYTAEYIYNRTYIVLCHYDI